MTGHGYLQTTIFFQRNIAQRVRTGIYQYNINCREKERSNIYFFSSQTLDLILELINYLIYSCVLFNLLFYVVDRYDVDTFLSYRFLSSGEIVSEFFCSYY